MQWRIGSLRVPSPSFGGWSLSRQEFSRHCFILTHRVRVAPVTLDGPWFEACPCDGRCFFHWNVAAGNQNPRNITTLYQKYLEVVAFTHRHTLSVDPRRRTSRIVSSWRFVLRTTTDPHDHWKNHGVLKSMVWQFVTVHK